MELLSFEEIQKRVEAARKHLTLESLAYFWLLYYCGCRKSEGYELKVSDLELSNQHFIVDFGERKKHGATVPPLKLPRNFPGVDLLVEQLNRARKRKPSRKTVQNQQPTGEMKKTLKGGMTSIMKTVGTTQRALWLFPHINRTWAIMIIKRILGKNYYPHFLRLNRLSEIGSDPEANIVRLKSYSGIKSITALEAYMGTSVTEQDAAIGFMAKKIKPQEARKKHAST